MVSEKAMIPRARRPVQGSKPRRCNQRRIVQWWIPQRLRQPIMTTALRIDAAELELHEIEEAAGAMRLGVAGERKSQALRRQRRAEVASTADRSAVVNRPRRRGSARPAARA